MKISVATFIGALALSVLVTMTPATAGAMVCPSDNDCYWDDTQEERCTEDDPDDHRNLVISKKRDVWDGSQYRLPDGDRSRSKKRVRPPAPKSPCTDGSYLVAPNLCCPIGTWLSGNSCVKPSPPPPPKPECPDGAYPVTANGCCPIGTWLSGNSCVRSTPSPPAPELAAAAGVHPLRVLLWFTVLFVVPALVLWSFRQQATSSIGAAIRTAETTTASAHDLNHRATGLAKEIHDFIDMTKRTAYRRGRHNF